RSRPTRVSIPAAPRPIISSIGNSLSSVAARSTRRSPRRGVRSADAWRSATTVMRVTHFTCRAVSSRVPAARKMPPAALRWRARHKADYLSRLRSAANRRLVWAGFSPLSSYLPSLHIQWGDSLLDFRSTDDNTRIAAIREAIRHYEKALRLDRNKAAAYSGLG